MDDNGRLKPEGRGNEESPIQQPVKVLLIIGITPEGKISVQGGVDKQTAINLLSDAIKVLNMYNEKNESRIIRPL